MEIGKLLLLGGVGYVAYNYFLAPSAPTPAPAPQSAGIQPANVALNPSTSQNLVQVAAANDGFTMGNVWQWDYYYKQVRGVDANLADKIPEAQRMANMTFSEWWALAQSNGLSGIIPTRGFGYVRAPRLGLVMEME